MKREIHPKHIRRLPPAFWLLIAIVLLAFSNGRWIVPAATWLGPVFMLHYLESTGKRRGLTLGLAASFLVWSFSWQAMIPAPGWLYFMVTAIYAVVFFLPYVAHRLLAADAIPYLSSLVFPTTWVTVDLLFQRFVSPYGSWTSLAYTQLEFHSLTQLASVTGSFGVTFLITWFASSTAWLWRTGFTIPRLRTAAIWYGIPFVVVTSFGVLRLATDQPAATSLRVAAITPSEELEDEFNVAFRTALTADTLDAAQESKLIDSADRLNADLVERSYRAAERGADLIAWSETAARVTNSGAEDLIAEGRRLVDTHGAILVLAYGTWDPESTPPLGNLLAILQPGDTTAVFYRKARPIIGAEAPLLSGRDSSVAIIETPGVRMATAICHDLDFADLIREAGRRKVSLLVGPSADWSEIADMHAGMATLRAVENGLVLVRPTARGRSIAVDAMGREAAWENRDGVLTTVVSPVHVSTSYARMGDLFAWLCVGGFLVVVVRIRSASGAQVIE